MKTESDHENTVCRIVASNIAITAIDNFCSFVDGFWSRQRKAFGDCSAYQITYYL